MSIILASYSFIKVRSSMSEEGKNKDSIPGREPRHYDNSETGKPGFSTPGGLQDPGDKLDKLSENASESKENSGQSADYLSYSEDYMVERERFDDHASDAADASSWAIPWSDLMMTMFILFAVMLVYTLSERGLKEALAKEKNDRGESISTENIKEQLSADQLFEMSKQTVKEANLEDIDVVMGSDRSVKVSVRGPMLFDLGSAELRDTTKEFLKAIALVLSRTENEVHIVGHTDNYPIHSESFPTNWELSSARAARVARYLIEQGPLHPERFTITGNAMYRPTVPNTTLENKQRNRRVEIIITRDTYKGTAGG